MKRNQIDLPRKKVFVFLVVLIVGLFVGTVQSDLTDGLVAYYPFNGNANDESGNGNHGTIYGATLTGDRCGNTNSAYSFYGDYIDIGKDSSLKMTDGLTISAWINMASYTPHYQNIISDHAPNEVTEGPGKILRFECNTLQFIVGGIHGWGTSIYVKYTFDNTMLGTWQHIVGTYDRNTVRLYLNGEEVDSRLYTAPLTVNTNHILIGKSGFGEYLNGIVDDVRIYNRALSASEVKIIYNALPLDTAPPIINSISANPNVLWPPNRKMVDVMVAVDCEDICDPAPVCFIVGVTCNEPISDPGEGNDPDWDYTDDPLVVLLRAECAGSGSGRVYTIHVNCVDASGNTATATVDVIVPRDKGKGKK